MTARKKIPGQFDESEKMGKGLADITKEIVRRDENRKKTADTERTHREHIGNTERTRFLKYKKTELETFSIRLSSEDKKRLQRYFVKRDIGLSQGIRIIIRDFIERQGI